MKLARIAGSIVLGLGLLACTTSPTGRSQLLLYSESDMASMGAQSFEQIKQQEKISQDAAVNAYVGCVANAVAVEVPGHSDPSYWEVVVFESEQVNAFALPGGKIGVYTGLLDVADNQDQLATVIGHELSHVLANHSNERMSSSQVAGVGMIAAGVAMRDNEHRVATMAALGVGVQVGVLLPYGRAQESEADIMGLDLMAQAGFDPRQSVALWQNMAKASGGAPPELLSTHPSHSTRIEDLTERLSITMPMYETAQKSGKKPNCTL